MQTIETIPGDHISKTAAQLCALAPARADFNGIEVVANVGDAPSDIVARFKRDSDARAAAYRASPEGIAGQAKDDWDRRLKQSEIDRLMAQLPSIDWSDHAAPIAWLCAMQDPADWVGVSYDRMAVVAAFKAHGYGVGVHTGDAFDPESRDVWARWLIGQALDCIDQFKAPHGMIHGFAADWRAKFGAVDRSPPFSALAT